MDVVKLAINNSCNIDQDYSILHLKKLADEKCSGDFEACIGRLIAAHISGEYIAYTSKGMIAFIDGDI